MPDKKSKKSKKPNFATISRWEEENDAVVVAWLRSDADDVAGVKLTDAQWAAVRETFRRGDDLCGENFLGAVVQAIQEN